MALTVDVTKFDAWYREVGTKWCPMYGITQIILEDEDHYGYHIEMQIKFLFVAGFEVDEAGLWMRCWSNLIALHKIMYPQADLCYKLLCDFGRSFEAMMAAKEAMPPMVAAILLDMENIGNAVRARVGSDPTEADMQAAFGPQMPKATKHHLN